MRSEQTNDLFKALSQAQAEMTGAKKDSDNPFFKSKYADLHAVLEAVKEPLAKNGLCVTQTIKVAENGSAAVTTTLGHESGQFISGDCPIINTKGDAQGMGSAITYARRYSLAAICGIAQMDDDGNAAVEVNPKHRFKPGEKDKIYDAVRTCLDNGDEHGLREVMAEYTDPDEKMKVWTIFNSTERSAITALLGEKK